MHYRCFRWLRVFSFFLFIAPFWSGVARCEPPSGGEANIDLTADASRQWAEIYIGVRGPILSGDEKQATAQVERALNAAMGGRVRAVEYYTLTEEQVEGGDSDTAAKKSPVGWEAYAGCAGGPVIRSGLIQSGQLDPTPLAAFLRSNGVSDMNIEVRLTTRGAPIATCSNARRLPQKAPKGRRAAQNAARRKSVVYAVAMSTASPTAPLSFRLGYENGFVWRVVAITLAIFIAPFLAMFGFRFALLNALRRGESAESASAVRVLKERLWFGLFRYLQFSTLAFALVWLIGLMFVRPTNLLEWAMGNWNVELRNIISVSANILPIIVIPTVMMVMARPLYSRLRGLQLTVGDMLLQSGAIYLFLLLPVAFLMLAYSSLSDHRFFDYVVYLSGVREEGGSVLAALGKNNAPLRWLGWLALAGATQWILGQFIGMSHSAPPVQLTAGELHDRADELAAKAGIKLKRFLYLNTGRLQMANAFALGGNQIGLTDRILSESSRAEIDGIIAHELAHLKHRHAQRKLLFYAALGGSMIVCGVGMTVFARIVHLPPDLWNRSYVYIAPFAVVIGVALELWLSRRWEKVADTEAIRMTGDPEGLILGLARLRRLSGMPMDWGRWNEKMLTHPSMRNRIRYLTEAGALSPEAVENLIAQADFDRPAPADERYALPADITTDTTLYSAPLRQRNAFRSNLLILVALIAVPLAFAFVAEHFFAENLLTAIGIYVLGALGSALSYLFLIRWRNLAAARSLVGPLRTRLGQRESMPRDAVFIGIAPGGMIRLYHGSPDWDIGFLCLEGDTLRFTGERSYLRIPREEIIALRPCQTRMQAKETPRLFLSWQDPATPGEVTERTRLTLRPLIARFPFSLRRETAALQASLERWRSGESEAAPTETDESDKAEQIASILPETALEEGVPLSYFTRPRSLWTAFRPLLLCAIGAGLLSGLPPRATGFLLLIMSVLLLKEGFFLSQMKNREP